MRKAIMSLLIMAGSLWAEGLSWHHAYDPALAAARAQHKLVYVFIDADGCPYCDRMRRNVLEQPDVTRSLHDYVLLNLKLNSPEVHKHFPKVFVTPTSYFLDSEGRVLIDFAGYTNEEFFFWRMGDAERIAAANKKGAQ